MVVTIGCDSQGVPIGLCTKNEPKIVGKIVVHDNSISLQNHERFICERRRCFIHGTANTNSFLEAKSVELDKKNHHVCGVLIAQGMCLRKN